MAKTTAALIFILFLLVVPLGYNYFFQPFAYLSEQSTEQIEPTPEPTPDPVQTALENMTPEEKIAQLFLVPVVVKQEVMGGATQTTASSSSTTASSAAALSNLLPASTLSEIPQETLSWFSEFKPGGVTVFGSKLTKLTVQDFVNELQTTQESVPLMVATDHEGGTTQRLSGSGFTILPSWQAQCSQPLEEVERLWSASAKELKEAGIAVIFAPVVDVAQNHPALKTRVCSSDFDQVIEYGFAFYRNFQTAGVQPVLKHFPGIGQTKRDLHLAFDSVTVGINEALVYQSLAENIAPNTFAVMTSHAGVKNQFADVPCSLSKSCVQEIKNVAPNALIFTDALEMQSALQDTRDLPEAARLAVLAGNTHLVFGPSVTLEQLQEIHAALLAQYSDNPEFRATVDQAVTLGLEFKRGT